MEQHVKGPPAGGFFAGGGSHARTPRTSGLPRGNVYATTAKESIDDRRDARSDFAVSREVLPPGPTPLLEEASTADPPRTPPGGEGHPPVRSR
jgi:hypothetical protein